MPRTDFINRVTENDMTRAIAYLERKKSYGVNDIAIYLKDGYLLFFKMDVFEAEMKRITDEILEYSDGVKLKLLRKNTKVTARAAFFGKAWKEIRLQSDADWRTVEIAGTKVEDFKAICTGGLKNHQADLIIRLNDGRKIPVEVKGLNGRIDD